MEGSPTIHVDIVMTRRLLRVDSLQSGPCNLLGAMDDVLSPNKSCIVASSLDFRVIF